MARAVGRIRNSILRRRASCFTSSITGKAPVPVPITRLRNFQGVRSSAESGVWPNHRGISWRATTTDVYMQEIPESVQKTVDAISAELRLLPNLEEVTRETSVLLPKCYQTEKRGICK